MLYNQYTMNDQSNTVNDPSKTKMVMVRMPPETLGKAKVLSVRQHRSISNLVIVAIEEKYERDIEGKQ